MAASSVAEDGTVVVAGHECTAGAVASDGRLVGASAEVATQVELAELPIRLVVEPFAAEPIAAG